MLATAACGADEPSVSDACADFCENVADCFDSGGEEDAIDDCTDECEASFEEADLDDECTDARIEGLVCLADLSCRELEDGDFDDCEVEIEDADDACEGQLDDEADFYDRCVDFCDRLEECDLGDADECAEDCEFAPDDSPFCEEAVTDFLVCVTDMSCSDVEAAFTAGDFGSCEDEGVEVDEVCDDGGGGDCCAADDPCDWANDGVCDCGGAYSWDAVDCAN